MSVQVETRGGLLVLRIPLAAGGDKFVRLTPGRINGDVLEITIPSGAAQLLGVGAGDTVTVGLQCGKFTIWPD